MSISRKDIQTSALYILFVSLMCLFFLKYALRFEIPGFLMLGIMVMMIILGNRDHILCVCALSSPLALELTTGLVILVAILVLVFLYAKNMKIDGACLPVFLLMGQELLLGLFDEFSMRSYAMVFTPFLLCLVLMWQDLKNVDYAYIVRMFSVCVAVLFVTLMAELLIASGWNVYDAITNMTRLGLQNTETTEFDLLIINPNSLGVVCVLAIGSLLQLFISGEGKRLDMPLLVFLMASGVLTMSRTFLTLLFITLLFALFCAKGAIRKRIAYLSAAVFAIFLVYLFFLLMFPDLVDRYMERFTGSDISGGRNALLVTYNQFLVDNIDILLFGLGESYFHEKITIQHAVSPNVPHNGIQELIITWGIIGLILFFWFVAEMSLHAKRQNRNLKMINWLPLVILASKVQVGQMITSNYTMIAFGFCYLSLIHDFDTNNLKKS